MIIIHLRVYSNSNTNTSRLVFIINSPLKHCDFELTPKVQCTDILTFSFYDDINQIILHTLLLTLLILQCPPFYGISLREHKTHREKSLYANVQYEHFLNKYYSTEVTERGNFRPLQLQQSPLLTALVLPKLRELKSLCWRAPEVCNPVGEPEAPSNAAAFALDPRTFRSVLYLYGRTSTCIIMILKILIFRYR